MDMAKSVAAQSGMKRRKAQMQEDHSNKKRVRVSYSCSECHRYGSPFPAVARFVAWLESILQEETKVRPPKPLQSCRGQEFSSFTSNLNCIQCLARKVSHLCQPYTPGKSERDMEARLARLEHIIETALPQYCLSNPVLHDPDDDSSSQVEDHETTGRLQSDGKWYGVSATGSVAPAEIIQQIQNVTEPGPSSERVGPPPNIADKASLSPPDILHNLMHECGVKTANISELLEELPPRHTSDSLIEFYFRDVNWTRYPISETDFRAAYNSLLKHRDEGLGSTSTNDVCFLGLLFVVLAISCRVARDDIVQPSQRRVMSLRYYWASRRSILIAAAIQPDTLWMVLTRLLSARFLTFDRRITECWSQLGAAVRTAQALGLHLDGSRMGMDAGEVEYRRRIWSYLYHADRSYSLVLGRPTSIQDYYTSTELPSNIDPDGPPPTQSLPLTTPTLSTFVILRHQLAAIIGKIAHHFQQVNAGGSYAEVIVLDDELLRFMTRLPPHFSLEPDTSLDLQHPYIPVHRFLLITEVLFVRTSLHRPYLLRKLKTDRYARSRVASYESVLKDFQVRQEYRAMHSPSSQRTLGTAYREFQMAMISGIYLILESSGTQAHAMRTILDNFIEDCRNARDLDETTMRELKIIEFLKKKANVMRGSAPLSLSGGDLDTEVSESKKQESNAQLLLGLHQATPHAMALTPTAPTLDTSVSPTLTQAFATGSPPSDEDSTAQFLLDNWCNSMNGGPSMNTYSSHNQWDGRMIREAQDAIPSASTHSLLVPDSNGGADWNYWETLLSHIQPTNA